MRTATTALSLPDIQTLTDFMIIIRLLCIAVTQATGYIYKAKEN